MSKIPVTRRSFIQTASASIAALSVVQPAQAAVGETIPRGRLGNSARCEIVPLPHQETSFQVDGLERLRWHFNPRDPRPFFFPWRGPSGAFLTRMGHPGTPNHDHHRSIWFAHQDVNGIDFWSDHTSARIRQKHWLCYEDHQDNCKMAVSLGWFGGEPEHEMMEQTLIAILRPGEQGESFLELQSSFRPSRGPVRLGKTNFGFLAIRVAKSISEYFGGGRLTDSEGRSGESNIFGKQAQWMDYSGAVTGETVEGITYFDHPANPRYPAAWHVREDGWMGASFCMEEGRIINADEPLRLRYMLHAHRGRVNPDIAQQVQAQFAKTPVYEVRVSKAKHHQFSIQPLATD